MQFLKKHTIKIPKDVQIIYFKKNKHLLISSSKRHCLRDLYNHGEHQ